MLPKALARRFFATTPHRLLIETQELSQLLAKKDPKLTILNASQGERQSHIDKRIPDSVFFDFTVLSDPKQPGLFMNPPEDHFLAKMKELDIRSNDTIIVYDKTGMNNAPRALWMFKNFGVDVVLLNGTFIKWDSEKRQVETGERPTAWRRIREGNPGANDFNFKLDASKIRSLEQIQSHIQKASNKDVLLDARPPQVHEAGHIPTAINVPFAGVLNDDKTFKSPEEIKKYLKSKGIENPEGQQMIVSCMKGFTACTLDAALKIIGNQNTCLYDGSYYEYSQKTQKN